MSLPGWARLRFKNVSSRGGARKKVRPDDQRGGARETTRPDAQARGPKKDLTALIRGARTHLQGHRLKYDETELRELQDEVGALGQDIRELLPRDEEWEGEIL